MLQRLKVSNLESNNGNKVPNQLEIIAETGKYFQSYNSIICYIPANSKDKIQLDSKYWNYSKTTSKYRNIFLGESTKETEAKIKSGVYELANLN